MDTKPCSTCGTVKALVEFHPQARGKYGHTAQCIECHRKRMRVPEHKRVRRRGKAPGYAVAYRKAHADELAAYSLNWRKENPADTAEATARMAKWRKENPEKARAADSKWSSDNPGKIAAKTRRRKAAKLRATPAWADHGLIDATYVMAAAMTRLTGIKYHVDHIVPLRNKIVCGLHVGCNLQLLPAKENISKGNHHWPDMP